MPLECGTCRTCTTSEWRLLDEAGVDRLTKSRHTVIYHEGETVFHQSDEALGIYCIETGNVLLHQYDAFGNETGFRVTPSGETLGWRSFFAAQPHAATAVALADCRICFVHGADLKPLIRDYPDLGFAFLKTLAKDRGPQEALLLRSPVLPVRVRVINLVLILARQQVGPEFTGEVAFTLPVKRHQLATMVGVRDETLSRALAGLNEEGLFTIEGRKVHIPDFERLKRVVNFELPS